MNSYSSLVTQEVVLCDLQSVSRNCVFVNLTVALTRAEQSLLNVLLYTRTADGRGGGGLEREEVEKLKVQYPFD